MNNCEEDQVWEENKCCKTVDTEHCDDWLMDMGIC